MIYVTVELLSGPPLPPRILPWWVSSQSGISAHPAFPGKSFFPLFRFKLQTGRYPRATRATLCCAKAAPGDKQCLLRATGPAYPTGQSGWRVNLGAALPEQLPGTLKCTERDPAVLQGVRGQAGCPSIMHVYYMHTCTRVNADYTHVSAHVQNQAMPLINPT